MIEPLRPASLSEILDRTAQLYRSRFFVFLGIALLPTAAVLVPICAMAAVSAFNSGAGRGQGGAASAQDVLTGLAFLGIFLVAAPVWLGATALAMAALAHASARAHMGQEFSTRSSHREAWRRGWRYLGLLVLQGLMVWAAPVVVLSLLLAAFGVAAAFAGNSGDAGTSFFLALAMTVIALAGGAYVIWMALRLSLAFPACVVEQMGPIAGLKRSAVLSRGTKGRIVLLFLLGAALNSLLSLAMMVPLMIAVTLIPALKGAQHQQTYTVVSALVVYGSMFAVQALTRPIFGIALVLFYYDQRIRQEGFDIEWMMLQAGLVPPAPPAVQAQPWLPAVLETVNDLKQTGSVPE